MICIKIRTVPIRKQQFDSAMLGWMGVYLTTAARTVGILILKARIVKAAADGNGSEPRAGEKHGYE